jgi:hypothetical protein
MYFAPSAFGVAGLISNSAYESLTLADNSTNLVNVLLREYTTKFASLVVATSVHFIISLFKLSKSTATVYSAAKKSPKNSLSITVLVFTGDHGPLCDNFPLSLNNKLLLKPDR